MIDFNTTFQPLQDQMMPGLIYWSAYFLRDIVLILGLFNTMFSLLMALITLITQKRAKASKDWFTGNLAIVFTAGPALFVNIDKAMFFTRPVAAVALFFIIAGWGTILMLKPKWIK